MRESTHDLGLRVPRQRFDAESVAALSTRGARPPTCGLRAQLLTFAGGQRLKQLIREVDDH